MKKTSISNSASPADAQGKAGDGLRIVAQAGAVLPHVPAAERGVVAAVLLDASTRAYAIAHEVGVRAGAFYDARLSVIWEICEELQKRGLPSCDAGLILAEAQATGRLEQVGGFAFVGGELLAETSTGVHQRRYAELVVECWQRRHAITLARRLAEEAWNAVDRIAWVGRAGEVGQGLIRLGRRSVRRTLAEEIASAAAEVALRAKGQQDRSGWIRTGIKLFDERYLPLGSQFEDHFIVVAGGSGHGKSAVMRQMASQALADGKRVLVFSRETSNSGFVEMLAALRADVDLRRPEDMPQDRLDAYQQEAKALIEIADKRLYCVQHCQESPLLTVEDLEDYIRSFAHLHGMPHLVVIDYLQLFTTRKPKASREQEIAQVSHKLQGLCRELGGVWLVGCQMNEAGLAEMRTPKRDETGKIIHRLPHAGDLRESQAIYHDADRVIALYLPPEDCRGALQNGPNVLQPEMWWVQIKRRRGGTGYVRTWFVKRYQKFIALGQEEESAASPPPGLPPARSAAGAGAASKPVPTPGMSKAAFKSRPQSMQTFE